MHNISPRNIPVACRKGWLNGLLVPSTDSEVMVSAHFTERVLKDPKTNIMPARPKWIGFQAMARTKKWSGGLSETKGLNLGLLLSPLVHPTKKNDLKAEHCWKSMIKGGGKSERKATL